MKVVNQLVAVETEADDDAPYPLGRPTTFTWERPGGKRVYRVREILGSWATSRLWWTDNLPHDAPLDIWHYRLEAQSPQGSGVLVLTLDVARQEWRLTGFED
ncbi:MULTISPECIES: DUF6504 family protein [Nonomuraea]|uniref:DUF6504 domain-containing protein n=1 Tax=Nonomuraea africana TaxID=46171 RepID=A0ABR9KY58_9ACTN|nr:DUF6504 family protein [Nonomuraea africana]MBE1566548.1 hypothetical protein [Nonomuraea africana]